MAEGRAHPTVQRSTATVLVVDEDPIAVELIRGALRDHRLLVAHSARQGLALLRDNSPDLMVLALELRELSGLRALNSFTERGRGVPIIATSSNASLPGAVEAVRNGAIDYLARPLHPRMLVESVSRALGDVRSRAELQRTQQDMAERYGFTHLLTRSPRMLQVFDQVRAVAPTDATVLIRGETGTGKELISRAIHERSRRRDQPFISVNCGAFTETLLESELFGHEKGSFTGAMGRRAGVFEMADGGTLFLDELGETSLNVQVNLLRVLEEMAFRRVGGHDVVRVDVRVLAATNVDLEGAVERGDFRQDLYYRLNVFPIELPPLRERREDIPLLIRHFLDQASQDYSLESPQISAEALQAILAHDWPGNVRELRSLCERWLITRAGQRLGTEHLGSDMAAPHARAEAGAFAVDGSRSLAENTALAVSQVERAMLHATLSKHDGAMEPSARALGVSRRTLYTKMQAYDLKPEDYSTGPRRGRPRGART